eukprot:m.920065 g.920065  ORF g.920065 m.920065 type:complete len:425 (+) comp61032_c0_seq1:239-1513(+)
MWHLACSTCFNHHHSCCLLNDLSSQMLVLVFPKPFEFGKFLVTLQRKNLLKEYVRVPVLATVYGLRVKGPRQPETNFLCVVVNESDIAFNAVFLAIVDELVAKLSPTVLLEFLAVGTAGAFQHGELADTAVPAAVGKAHFINRAFKIDRAVMKDGPDGTIVFELPERHHDKIISHTVNEGAKHLYSLEPFKNSRAVLCSNMLMESTNLLNVLSRPTCPASVAIKSPEDCAPGEIRAIVDMETFDFFAVCKSRGVPCLGAIRLISDVCGDPLSNHTRALVDFEEAAAMFLVILNRFSSSLGAHDWTWRTQSDDLVEDFADVMHDKVERVCAAGPLSIQHCRTIREYARTTYYSDRLSEDFVVDLPRTDILTPRELKFAKFLLEWYLQHRRYGSRFVSLHLRDEEERAASPPDVPDVLVTQEPPTT